MANLTGGQIQEVMDGLLYHSLTPVVMNTTSFDQQLVYMVHLIISNKKRKPYSCDKENPLTFIVRALHTDDREAKLKLIRSLKLERNFVYSFIQKLLDLYYEPFMDLYQKFIAGDGSARSGLDSMCRDLGCGSRVDLYKTLTSCNRYLAEFKAYFNSVVSDYLLFCTQQAKFSVNNSNGRHYDFKDVQQNFLRNVIVAINKYDCSRGALTGYIKFWIMNARTSGASEHEYGIAYVVPQTKRKDIAKGGAGAAEVNFSVSLDAQSDDQDEDLHDRLGGATGELDGEMDISAKARRIALLAKSVDPYGAARLVMDLPEVFVESEIRQMRDYSQNCKTLISTSKRGNPNAKRV